MALPKLLEDLAFISKLGDYPGSDDNLTPEQFRERFDVAALRIQEYLNNQLIPGLDQLVDVQALLNGILDPTLSLYDRAANAKVTGDALANRVNKSGDTMTGYLNVPTPKQSDHVASKGYVDSKKKAITVTLYASAWSQNSQTVVATGVLTADKCDVLVSPTAASYKAYHENFVQASAQSTDSLTFVCTKVPTTDLNVNVLILK